MSGSINRKGFVTALGAAGLGLGLTVTGVGRMPVALAQEATTPAAAEQETGPLDQRLERRQEFYADFTAALASELGIASADEVDGGIRKALMTVIDARTGEGVLTAGQAEALKTLVATSEVPFGPLAMMGPPPGRFIHIERGEHFGPGWDDDDHGTGREQSGSDEPGESSEPDVEEAGQ